MSTFFAVEDEHLVGFAHVRHELNDVLLNEGGPSQILALALEQASLASLRKSHLPILD